MNVAVTAVGVMCRNCGTTLAGPFCHECGQGSPRARRTLAELLTGQTGRFLHTLKLLLLQPGELAREIDEGRDRRSMRPLTLLFHLIALFFLLSGVTGFGTRAIEQADPSGAIAAAIERHADAAAVPAELYRERLERRFETAYTLALPLIALSIALVIGLLHRRWVKPAAVTVAAGIQYLCFAFLWLAAWLTLLRILGIQAYGLSPVLLVELGVSVTYMTLMLRRIYDQRTPLALAKSVAIVAVSGAINNLVLYATLLVALASL